MRENLNVQMGETHDDDERGLSLSCLIDGELDRAACDRLLVRFRFEESVQRQWRLLNTACDALRSNEVAAMHSEGFVQRVAVALAREPALLAPSAWSSHRLLRRVVAPGVAVAAAVTLLAVVAVPQLTVSDAGRAQVATTPATPSQAPALTPVEVARVPELERYLLAHRELAGGTVMPVSTPYLRTSNAMPAEGR